jgi:hypothetical protein
MNKKLDKFAVSVSSSPRSSSRQKEKGGLVRVQLDLPQEKIDELNSIMRKVKLDTRKDLFNNALSTFAWAVGEKENGRAIFAIDENTNIYKELVMHPLESITAKTNDLNIDLSKELRSRRRKA